MLEALAREMRTRSALVAESKTSSSGQGIRRRPSERLDFSTTFAYGIHCDVYP